MWPYSELLRLLRKLVVAQCAKNLKRTLGLFSFYSHWTPHFSEKIAPLVRPKLFPLQKKCWSAFNLLKEEVETAVVVLIDTS